MLPQRRTVALVATLALIATATLTPMSGTVSQTGFLCLGCGAFGATDIVVNVLLFVPLGLLLGRGGITPMRALGVGLAVSGLIELAQVYIPGRAPTLRDVLVNGTGSGLGALLVLRLRDWLHPGPRTRVLTWVAATAAMIAIAATGWLFRFQPPGGVYYGQWAPNLGQFEQWTGSVGDARVSGRPIGIGPIQESGALRAMLERRVSMQVEAVAGTPTRRLGSIFSIFNDAQELVLLVGPVREDLVVRVRRVAASWRFDAPEFRFRGALAGIPAGRPLSISFEGTRLGGCATVNGARHCVGRPRAGGTWQLARSLHGAPALARRALDALSLLILLLPLALLLPAVPRREAYAVGVAVVGALPLVAWSSGLAIPTLWEWSGVALAFGAGVALNRKYFGVRPAPASNRSPAASGG